MFQIDPICGRSLQLKKQTVCLTFDDGPGESREGEAGPKTLKLAEYLAKENVAATFFVVGMHAEQFPEIINRLSKLGHLIGNHTWSHPDLSGVADGGGDATNELMSANKVIPPPNNGGSIFFRAPFGTWPTSICNKLNQDPKLRSLFIGPVGWDVDERDWEHWQRDEPPQVCMEKYFSKIESHETGVIVLQHDHSANNPELAAKNRTYEMTELLVPRLKERGYEFARLDALEEMKAVIQKR